MLSANLQAVVACHELPLSRIAQAVGITKKLKWEEPLFLQGAPLNRLLPAAHSDQKVYLYPFGSLVFVDFSPGDILLFLQSLQVHSFPLSPEAAHRFREEYHVTWGSDRLAVGNDLLRIPAVNPSYEEIVATVLAKSVALEAIEIQVDALLDEIETTIAQLHQGKLSTSDTDLARLFGRILEHKLTSVSSLMLLDKPDSTWEDEQASLIFSQLHQLFELTARFDIIRHKSDTLISIAEVFSGLVHARRSTLLEWGIILLIMIEIFLTLWQMH